MANIHVIDTAEFLQRLTGNKLSQKQTASAAAYLRAKGLCFYDNWSKSHVSILAYFTNEAKNTVIEALKISINKHQ